jgi:hypothetical protein
MKGSYQIPREKKSLSPRTSNLPISQNTVPFPRLIKDETMHVIWQTQP